MSPLLGVAVTVAPGPGPALLVAVTVNVYVVLFVRLPTRAPGVVVVIVCGPGVTLTV